MEYTLLSSFLWLWDAWKQFHCLFFQRRDKLHWRTNGSFFWHNIYFSLQLHTSPGRHKYEETHSKFQLLFQDSMASSGLLDIDNVEAYSVKSGGSRAAEDLADFDRLIQFSWQQKMDEGAFRYPFQHPQCKKLLGNYNYLAQFNSFRVIILISWIKALWSTVHTWQQLLKTVKFLP